MCIRDSRVDGLADALGDPDSSIGIHVLQQDSEFVAAQAGDRIVRSVPAHRAGRRRVAHRRSQALRHMNQQLIAGQVPQAVVCLLYTSRCV